MSNNENSGIKNHLDLIDKIDYMLNGKGESCDFGWFDSEQAAIDKGKEISTKPICVVKAWAWIDIEPFETLNEEAQLLGVMPSLILADHVAYDEHKRFSVGSTVRSSLLYQFHQSAFFETNNTTYVLLGKGTRKLLPISAINTIMFN